MDNAGEPKGTNNRKSGPSSQNYTIKYGTEISTDNPFRKKGYTNA